MIENKNVKTKNWDEKFVMNQFYEENSKTQIVTKLKNSNFDNSKT